MKVCAIEGCEKAAKGRHCSMHAARVARHGDPAVTLRPRLVPCSVSGCDQPRRKHSMCPKHHARFKATGSTDLKARPRWDRHRTCAVCRADFTLTQKPRRQTDGRYCSKACFGVTRKKPLPACRVCSQPAPIGKEFCSRRCSSEQRRIARNRDAACVTCGGRFERRLSRPDSAFCSRACAARQVTFTCTACGSQGVGGRARKMCEACSWERRGRLQNRANVQRYKALKRGTAVEQVDPMDIFDRDEWTCRLCLLPIDTALRHPHRLSATIDHVVPLSRGGSHTRENLQAAHLSCNSSKGNRIGGPSNLWVSSPWK